MYLPLLHYYYCFHEAKLCLRKLILLLFFSQVTPLLWSAFEGRLEVSRLLVESKADVAATNRCFSPPPSHHISLTICLAAVAKLHSNWPPSSKKPTSLHTCAASARLNDALPRTLLISSAPLSFTDRVTDRRVSLVLVADGKLQTPEELLAARTEPAILFKINKSPINLLAVHRGCARGSGRSLCLLKQLSDKRLQVGKALNSL